MNSKCLGNCHNQNLACVDNWHGKYGHFNVATLDHDSSVTGFGTHDRCNVTTHGNRLEVLVGDRWSLGTPTTKEVLKAARLEGWRGRWRLVAKDDWIQNNELLTLFVFEK